MQNKLTFFTINKFEYHNHTLVNSALQLAVGNKKILTLVCYQIRTSDRDRILSKTSGLICLFFSI